ATTACCRRSGSLGFGCGCTGVPMSRGCQASRDVRPWEGYPPLAIPMAANDEPELPPIDAAARVRAAALVGRAIADRYRIDELVGMGGMGAVYRGEHLRMRKRIAIKVLHPDIEGRPELVARFEREAVAGAQLSHPNIAPATDFGEIEDGSTFLIL